MRIPFFSGLGRALPLLLACALQGAPAGPCFRLANRTQGPLAALPIYVTVTGCDAQGRMLRMDPGGVFHPCVPQDNRVPAGGTTWCAYSFPLSGPFRIAAGQTLSGGRLYLSIGAPLHLRVDPATGGLVQPDLANPSDPNAGTTFDWVEFALDASGFHGNTTCVDQFGLPIILRVRDASGTTQGPVGLAGRRSDLLREFQANAPAGFSGLADPAGKRITAPGHAQPGTLPRHFDAYIKAMWDKYRRDPLVLTPDQGTFTGRVDALGRMVFTREGDPCPYLIRTMPTTLDAFRCDGPLAEGNSVERVLGAQIAALINRHRLESPAGWRDAGEYYQDLPSNGYARFWHERGLGNKAYGFPYDDVNDQATLVYSAHPEEIVIEFRID